MRKKPTKKLQLSFKPITKDNLNAIGYLHPDFADIPIIFRDRCCEQCSWSIPTYYRKVRKPERKSSGKHSLSVAEERMILTVALQLNEEVRKNIMRVRARLKRMEKDSVLEESGIDTNDFAA